MKKSYRNEFLRKQQFSFSTSDKSSVENFVNRNRYAKEIELHKLYFNSPSKVSLDGIRGKTYTLSETGFETIRKLLEIPRGYIQKISSENITANLNKRLQEIDPEGKKKKMLISETSEIEMIDGFVSTSFNYVDDKKILGLFYTLKQLFHQDFSDVKFQVVKTNSCTVFKFTFSDPNMNLEIRKGDILNPGFMVINPWVLGSHEISNYYERVVCANGMTTSEKNGYAYYKNTETTNKILNEYRNFLCQKKNFENELNSMRNMTETKIDSEIEAPKIESFYKKMVPRIKNVGFTTYWDLYNFLTHSAKALSPTTEISLQKKAGELIPLFTDKEKTLEKVWSYFHLI